jgi:hypothetical protein
MIAMEFQKAGQDPPYELVPRQPSLLVIRNYAAQQSACAGRALTSFAVEELLNSRMAGHQGSVNTCGKKALAE